MCARERDRLIKKLGSEVSKSDQLEDENEALQAQLTASNDADVRIAELQQALARSKKLEGDLRGQVTRLRARNVTLARELKDEKTFMQQVATQYRARQAEQHASTSAEEEEDDVMDL